MDIFDEEILKFWAALQKWQVKYIMVGGYAANLHGYQRYTGDMDIWIDETPENRKRLRNAFIDWNGRLLYDRDNAVSTWLDRF